MPLTHTLLLRVLSALLLMPFVIAALILGGGLFWAMVILAAGMSCYEWLKMARLAPSPVMHAVLGLVYLIVCFAAFVYLRLYEFHGAGLALSLILSVWASDSGAYFAGKTIGGPKMAPKISPNKTWAGLIGGMAASTAVLVVYAFYAGPWLTRLFGADLMFPEGFTGWELALTGAVITLSGQAGDLLISKEKRLVGVKDTGNLIPGHGGLLDRIDALLLASVFFSICLEVLGS